MRAASGGDAGMVCGVTQARKLSVGSQEIQRTLGGAVTEDQTRCVRDIPAQSKAWGLPNDEANKKRKDSFYPCHLEFGLNQDVATGLAAEG